MSVWPQGGTVHGLAHFSSLLAHVLVNTDDSFEYFTFANPTSRTAHSPTHSPSFIHWYYSLVFSTHNGNKGGGALRFFAKIWFLVHSDSEAELAYRFDIILADFPRLCYERTYVNVRT